MSPRREAGGTNSDVEEAAPAAEPTTRPADTRKLRHSDRVALDEIELYAEVLSAVAVVDHRLTPEELDEVLGLLPKREMTIPVAIYLAIEDDHEMVEQALRLF